MSKLFSGTEGALEINTADVADDAITLAKMAPGTDGQIITYDASGNPSVVGPGTDGQVLTSTGAGSPPAFEDAGGGAWTFLQTQTASSSSSIDFTSNIDSTYAAYKIICSKVEAGTDTASFVMRVSTDGGSSYASSSGNYHYHLMRPDHISGPYSGSESGTAQTNLKLGNSMGTAAGENCSFEVTVFDPSDSTHHTLIMSTGVVKNSGAYTAVSSCGGSYTATTAVDAFRFMFDSGNIASGRFTLYGVKHS